MSKVQRGSELMAVEASTHKGRAVAAGKGVLAASQHGGGAWHSGTSKLVSFSSHRHTNPFAGLQPLSPPNTINTQEHVGGPFKPQPFPAGPLLKVILLCSHLRSSAAIYLCLYEVDVFII